MDYTRANLGPEFAHDGATYLMALSIRDSQVPVPNATEVCGSEDVAAGIPLKEAGLVGQILAAVCIALVLTFMAIVARGL